MILIADAGATKTHWRLLANEEVHQFQSTGHSPTAHEEAGFLTNFPDGLLRAAAQVNKIYYYGAGLTSDDYLSWVHQKLLAVFNDAEINVHTDLLGAARSLFGEEAGVACILGTGSAVCFYDGTSITRRIASLGYVLGDEGSGAFLGKKLLSSYLRGLLSPELTAKFEQSFGKLEESEVLQATYKQNHPNTYLAGFAKFLVENQSDPFLYQLIYDGIENFFLSYFGKDQLRGTRIRFTGSIAYWTSNLIRKYAREHDLIVDLISQNPISGLTLYHQKYG